MFYVVCAEASLAFSSCEKIMQTMLCSTSCPKWKRISLCYQQYPSGRKTCWSCACGVFITTSSFSVKKAVLKAVLRRYSHLPNLSLNHLLCLSTCSIFGHQRANWASFGRRHGHAGVSLHRLRPEHQPGPLWGLLQGELEEDGWKRKRVHLKISRCAISHFCL